VLVQRFVDPHHGCAAYLVAAPRARRGADADAAVIDPGPDLAPYEAAVAAGKLRLRYVIDTHVHADHVSGARALAAAYAGRDGATLCLHESAPVAYPFRVLRDGEVLALGARGLRVLHLPGHRPEQIGLLITAAGGRRTPAGVFTGDALLAGDVGRPEGRGGDAHAQRRSVARLLALPDRVPVYPGHVAGDRVSSTIGDERRDNPVARLLADESAFVAALARDPKPRPLNMRAIEATNLGLEDLAWAMLIEAPDVPQITLEALEVTADWPAALGPPNTMDAPQRPLLVDVREPVEYTHGHVPGAVNVPQAELATSLASLSRDRPVATICDGGTRALRAAQFLRQRGFAHVGVVAGGTAAWRLSGRAVASAVAATPPFLCRLVPACTISRPRCESADCATHSAPRGSTR
jgi:glyoxylase-like metal-dependent hydrolase (beta-lactamase superfamily II)/rhodanese-related sulfurtransferase